MITKHIDLTTDCSYNYTDIEWNEAKSALNCTKHGLALHDARKVLDDFHLERIDNRKDYGEMRFIVLGVLEGREVVLVYTPRGNKKRIISLRKANVQEQKAYQQQRLKALGCNA